MLQSINPFTGKVIRSWDGNTPEEVDQIIEKADRAFRRWRNKGMDKRAEKLRNLAHLLESGNAYH